MGVNIVQAGMPLIWIVGGYLVGVAAERVIIAYLTRLAQKTRWEGDDIILAALRRFPTLVGTLTGLYFALKSVELPATTSNFVHKTFLVLLILGATFVICRLSVGFLNLWVRGFAGGLASTTLFSAAAQIVIFALGILTVLHMLGISITPILTALGVGGLAVALALQDTLANLFAGLHLLAARKIAPGQYIALDTGQEGTVVDISWRNTTLETLKGNMVIVPNSKLASAIVTNYHLPESRLTLSVEVGVSYSSDLDFVERIALEVARGVIADFPGADPDFSPVVRFTGFGESSVNLIVALKVKSFSDQFVVRSELYRRLFKRFAEVGIEIPFPVRTVYFYQKEPSTPPGLATGKDSEVRSNPK